MQEFSREDFIRFLEGLLNTEDQDDSPTTEEINDKFTEAAQEDAQIEVGTTLIERVIVKFLKRCEVSQIVPTAEQSHSIKILDEINRRYTAPDQIGIRKGTLDADNRAKLAAGVNFEFNGSLTDMVRIQRYA